MDRWLVLCEPRDVAALWAANGLRSRGLEPLELVSGTEVACGIRWEHRVGADGVLTRIELADGRTLGSETTKGVLNRLAAVPADHLTLAAPGDREYALEELTALFVSWLGALPCRVLNPPVPPSIAGSWWEYSQWVWLAGRAGLPTANHREPPPDWGSERGPARPASFGSSRAAMNQFLPLAGRLRVRELIVIDESVIGECRRDDITAGCRRLAQLAGTPLLGVEFVKTADDEWTFSDASTMPDLRRGGPLLLDALAVALG
jgi:hypothetical protein